MDGLISTQKVLDLWERYHPYIATEACAFDAELRKLLSTESQILTDTISRQEAINSVAEDLKHVFVKYRDVAEKMINKLPSAQPEIIRCKDCKHGSPNGRYGCRVYHYKRYETHDMKPDDFCSFAERREK